MEKSMKQVNKKQLLRQLPFDQYSRQLIVSRLIDDAIRPLVDRKIAIIDLGGHKGKTHDFQPNDNVTILDVFNVKYKDYVHGDATKTNFKDDEFDVAVSFDVFEHIPREKRKAFIREALRISKYGVFLATPIDTDSRVISAEVLLNNFYKIIFNKDHPWLKEHIDYRIPNEEEIKKLVIDQSAKVVSVGSNQLGDWQLMQMLIFAAANNNDISKEVSMLNSWYNNMTSDLDANIDIGYRKIFFVSKDKECIQKVQLSIEKFSKHVKDNDYVTVHRELFEEFSRTLATTSKKYNQINKQFIEMHGEIEELHNKLSDASEQITKLTNDLNSIYSSTVWKVFKPLRSAEKIGRKLRNK